MISVCYKKRKHEDVLKCREGMAMGDETARKTSKKEGFELRGER